MRDDHVQSYVEYVRGALRREGVPVDFVNRNPFDKDFSFGLTVRCSAPWEQYDRGQAPGTWLRTIRRGETVHDVIEAYKKAYE